MRPRAADVFSDWIWMLETAFSKRLCSAPRLAREELICASALSICTIAVCALVKLWMFSPAMPVVATAAVVALAKPATVALLVVPATTMLPAVLRSEIWPVAAS